ncbi:MerR family transcriptional regulator [bacterium]|nr:MerR family transcriptional regulator [bacterium]
MASVEKVPDKLYFRIGEVSRIVGVKPYVLRYWEKEFSAIKPEKSSSKQRLYRREDVLLFCQIRRLLHEERFTIEGCRKRISESKRVSHGNLKTDCIAHLKSEILAVRSMIQSYKKN